LWGDSTFRETKRPGPASPPRDGETPVPPVPL
jgi:hypothetical protein